jgi:hypothetical protein
VESAAPETAFHHPLFNGEYNGKTGAGLYSPQGVSQEQQELNITTHSNAGELVDNGYFSATTVHGVINYTNLNEDSYKEFGFAEVGESFERPNAFTSTEDSMRELSKLELSEMTAQEKAGLHFFTSSNYEWLNRVLYKKESPAPPVNYAEPPLTDIEEEEEKFPMLERREQTAARVKEVTEAIDSSMSKAPKKQRVLYRGMSPHNKAFPTTGDPAKNVQEWLDNNVSLGQELVFDGYQSSSPDLSSAMSYCGDGGVIYEILSSEGVNVADVSDYPWEKEVLLPRGARYMVVGVHRNKKITWGRRTNVVQLVAINSKGAVLDGTNADPAPELSF